MKVIRITTLIALLAAAVVMVAAQQPPAAPAPDSQTPTFKTGTEEVILDIVIRDKKGKAILDVTPEELSVEDNGVKQKITSLRLVQGREAIEKGSKVPLDALKQLRLVTLVFEQMDEQGRRLAKEAALNLIKGDQGTNVFYSVVVINNQLYALQEFTNDKAKLEKAIEMATSGQSLTFAAASEKVKSQIRDQLQRGGGPAAPVTDTSDPRNAQVEARLAGIMSDMLHFDAAGSVTEGTRTSIFALLSLVRGQYTMPGRKTLLYFSQGMWLPPHLDEPFNSISSTANRGNISIYAVDTRGVGAGSNSGAAYEMQEAAKSSAASVTRDDGRVSVDEIKAGDRAENSMRSNTQMPLRTLSDSTGGFLVGESNDLRTPLKRVNEDINAYYEVSYSPGIQNYDGKFRSTKFEIARKDLVVKGGKGYFAIPANVRSGGAMLPYEFALLKALDTTPLPADVEFRASAIKFQPSKDSVKGTVVVEVPMKGIQATEDKATNTFKVRISLVALLKDEKGEIVKKLSRDLPLSGPTSQIPQVKGGNFIYKEQFSVPPGKYTLEAAVIDHEANKLSAKKSPFVDDYKPGVAISSLTQVRNHQPGAKDLDPADPYQYQGGKITPTLADRIFTAKGAQLSLFFVVYPDPAIKDKPTLTIEYLQGGQSLAKADLPLPPADAFGNYPDVFSSPAETMPPGAYDIKVTVKQGSTTAEATTTITVEAR